MQPKKERIIFLDIMRATAVFLMLEGHTVHALLSNDYRSFDSIVFNIWFTIRGFTAPIFMFTAGTVFTYLLNKNKDPFFKNIRIKKGLKRVILLLVVGYLLRFPTFKLSGIDFITEKQWLTFFAVDALHLIGFGLFFVMIVRYISELTKINSLYFYFTGTLIFFLFSPVINQIQWSDYLPLFFASYLTTNYGSIFPLFPWIGFILAGAFFGKYLAANGMKNKRKLAVGLAAIGFLSIFLSYSLNLIEGIGEGKPDFWNSAYSLPFWRIGIILILNSIVILLTQQITSVPKAVQLYGKHSLVIYAVHLMIIYGSALFPGLLYVFGETLNVFECFIVVILLMSAMLLMTWLLEYYNKNSETIYATIKSNINKIRPGVK